jgi:hypothetical protein
MTAVHYLSLLWRLVFKSGTETLIFVVDLPYRMGCDSSTSASTRIIPSARMPNRVREPGRPNVCSWKQHRNCTLNRMAGYVRYSTQCTGAGVMRAKASLGNSAVLVRLPCLMHGSAWRDGAVAV